MYHWPNKITIPWRRKSSPLSSSSKISAPCSLALCFSYTLITKISHLPLSTTAAFYDGVHTWKSMSPLSSITLARKMSLPTNSHESHTVMCCQFQWGRMLLLSSSISLEYALTSAMSLILKCFLNFPLHGIAENNPVDLKWIINQQNTSIEPTMKAKKCPNQYFNKLLYDHVIVWHALPNEDCLTQWKMALTIEIVLSLIMWFNSILAYPGCKSSRMTIQTRYYHPDIRRLVDNFHCDYCQCTKIPTEEWDSYQHATSQHTVVWGCYWCDWTVVCNGRTL